MRTNILAAAIAVAVGSPDAARAGDGFVWDSKKPVAHAAGERRFVEEKTSVRHNVQLKIAGRPRETRDDRTAIEFRYVDEVAAAASGKVTRRRIELERWSLTGCDLRRVDS